MLSTSLLQTLHLDAVLRVCRAGISAPSSTGLAVILLPHPLPEGPSPGSTRAALKISNLKPTEENLASGKGEAGIISGYSNGVFYLCSQCEYLGCLVKLSENANLSAAAVGA